MNYIFYIICSIISICSILFGVICYFYYKNNTINIKQQIYNEIKSQNLAEQDREIQNKNVIISNLDKEIQQKKEFNTTLLVAREHELESIMKEKKLFMEQQLQLDVDTWAKSAQEAANFNATLNQEILQTEIGFLENKKDNLLKELNEYKAKRDAVNEDILRSRAVEEEQNFYRVQLDDSAKEDIAFLLSIIDRFNNKEVIYKIIWSEYIQKSFKSMMNRVLSGRDPKNVIYMIKNMDTNEIYIGKTKAEVSKRWTEHIKTSLNIGTISRTNIHKALFNNWDKFSFTVLEEVPSDASLGEREKYYIKFYESDVFGYNIKSGG